MADKIVVLNGGRVEQVGAPMELYDRPANVFVAGFMGSPAMNLIPAAVKGGILTVAGQSLPCGLADGPVTFGLRPGDIAIGLGVEGRILVVEPTGSETHLSVDVHGQVVTVVTRSRQGFQPGAPLALDLSSRNAHLFDAGTGRRIAA